MTTQILKLTQAFLSNNFPACGDKQICDFGTNILISWVRKLLLLKNKLLIGIVNIYRRNFCKGAYFGTTYSQSLTRAAEHISISNFTGKYFKSFKKSAASDHLLESNCPVD